jgi:hypothetical protein
VVVRDLAAGQQTTVAATEVIPWLAERLKREVGRDE